MVGFLEFDICEIERSCLSFEGKEAFCASRLAEGEMGCGCNEETSNDDVEGGRRSN